MLTLRRLGLDGALWRTLRSTNAIENLVGTLRQVARNVKRWSEKLYRSKRARQLFRGLPAPSTSPRSRP
jgi:hypothetical protein